MSTIPITTVDLLLNLGLKVTDALAKAQSGRINSKEQQAIRDLQTQHLATLQAYQQIRTFLATFRQVWDRALVEDKYDRLYEICTQSGYTQQLQLIQDYKTNQIIQAFTHKSDLLDIRLITDKHDTTALTGTSSTVAHCADVYVYADETLTYRDGRDVRVSSLEVCRLVLVQNAWKLNAVESLCIQYSA